MTALAAITRRDRMTPTRILEALLEDLTNAKNLDEINAAREKAAEMADIQVGPMRALSLDEYEDDEDDGDYDDEEDDDEGLELGPFDDDESDAFGAEDEEF